MLSSRKIFPRMKFFSGYIQRLMGLQSTGNDLKKHPGYSLIRRQRETITASVENVVVNV